MAHLRPVIAGERAKCLRGRSEICESFNLTYITFYYETSHKSKDLCAQSIQFNINIPERLLVCSIRTVANAIAHSGGVDTD